MKLNLGTNFLFPTAVTITKFDITDNIVEQAIGFGEITDDLQQQVVKGFDEHLKSTLDKTTSDWYHYRLQSWVNKYEKGHAGMEMHTHAGAQLSAIAILEAGRGGELVFQDPRSFASRGYDLNFRPLFNNFTYEGNQGDLIIFPSFLYHSVRPVNMFRVSAAFDMYLLTGDF
jgi:hypothetical protein